MEQATFNSPRVMRLGRNEGARDFVVGDIHGAFDLVIDAMRAVCFDPEADRLLSVGDLIDRGPGSHRCAACLAKPYVYAVRGNHEDMLIELYAEGAPAPAVLQIAARYNGLDWWLDVKEEQRQTILDAIRKLPLAIGLETTRGTVGLIHADVPRGMRWGEFLDALEAGHSEVIKTCLWGRDRILAADDAGVQGWDGFLSGTRRSGMGLAASPMFTRSTLAPCSASSGSRTDVSRWLRQWREQRFSMRHARLSS